LLFCFFLNHGLILLLFLHQVSYLSNFHLDPSDSSEVVFILIKFAANQLFVLSYFEDFSPTSIFLKLITFNPSCSHKKLFFVIEIYLQDSPFILKDDGFNWSYFHVWVKLKVWLFTSLCFVPALQFYPSFVVKPNATMWLH
jgi:hypothetical protein